ncbi:MAG: response regulator [Dehalococcoidia bacterium]
MPTALAQERTHSSRCTNSGKIFRNRRVNYRLWSPLPGDPPPGNTPASILVVEDESIFAVLLRRRLGNWGYAAPEHAVSGQEAIEKALRIQPNLILMDIRLLGPMDGITAALEIQRQMDVPVIFMSAFSDDETVRRAEETNCSGFLSKPIDDELLRTTIKAALNGKRGEPGG